VPGHTAGASVIGGVGLVEGFHPHTAHLWPHLAVTVGTHTAAGAVAQLLGQFIGQDMPVELSTQRPHILQSNSSPLTTRSTAATGRSRRR